MNHAVASALRKAAGDLAGRSETPRLEAEILLAHALDRPRSWLIARPDEPLGADAGARYEALVRRRAAGWPVAYLTGLREFWSRPFHVTPDVLVPRPETEHLVEAALERLPADAPRRVADLGTGSGVIAVTIALERPGCEVVGVDISEKALAVARENARRLGAVNTTFRCADWLADTGADAFDVIVSNPPYVDADDPRLAADDLRFEPLLALAAADRGIAAIRTIIEQARTRLAPGGWLLLEHGADQRLAVADLLRMHGYEGIEVRSDLAGRPRVALARRGS